MRRANRPTCDRRRSGGHRRARHHLDGRTLLFLLTILELSEGTPANPQSFISAVPNSPQVRPLGHTERAWPAPRRHRAPDVIAVTLREVWRGIERRAVAVFNTTHRRGAGYCSPQRTIANWACIALDRPAAGSADRPLSWRPHRGGPVGILRELAGQLGRGRLERVRPVPWLDCAATIKMRGQRQSG